MNQEVCKEKNRISIILPVYQVEKYLPQCLDSIFYQKVSEKNFISEESLGNQQWAFANWVQVIAVDDGSKDRCAEILDEYATRFQNFLVIHQANAGVAAARNNGFKAATGEWVYFMDSDDWLAEGALERMLANCQKEASDCDVILMDGYQEYGDKTRIWEHFSSNRVFTTKEERLALQCATLYFPYIGREDKPLEAEFADGKSTTLACGKGSPIAAPWDKLYRREFLEKNNLHFTENLKVLDDMVFNFEVFGKASKVSYRKDRIYHYRYVLGSITNQYKADRVDRDCQVFAYLRAAIEREKKEETNHSLEQKEAVQEQKEAELEQKEAVQEQKEAVQQKEVLEQKDAVQEQKESVQEQNEELHQKDMMNQNERIELEKALDCRIIKSFAICCRLTFFHPKNEKSLAEQKKEVERVLAIEPYRTAFSRAPEEKLEWKLKAVVWCCKRNFITGLYLLHKAQMCLQ